MSVGKVPFRAIIVTAVLVLCTSLWIARLFATDARLMASPEDLRAFYCAGEAVATKRDPYRAEPLRACEVRETHAAGLSPYENLAIPAPLPGYALVPFAILSRQDFAKASTIYYLLQMAALGASVILLVRLTSFGFIAIAGALVLSVGMICAQSGQLFPFVLVAVCASAFALCRHAYGVAACAASCALIEPHVALPAIVAVAIFAPRTRLAFLICGAVLAALTLIATGPDISEYVTRVLPAHALSEAASSRQFSLLTVLIQANVPIPVAITIANTQYAVMCLLGIVSGGLLARRYGANELMVLVPPACAAFGGPFLHITQAAIAIPAAFALANRVPTTRAYMGVAVLLLAVPWFDLADDGAIAGMVSTAAVATAVAAAFWKTHRGLLVAAVLAACFLSVGEWSFRASHPGHASDPSHAIAAVAEPDRLAEATWTAYESATVRARDNPTLPARIPTWCGLALVAAVAYRAALDSGSRGLRRASRLPNL